MTYRSGGSVLGEEGTPHPEPMRRVVGAEVQRQRLPLVPADLWQELADHVELKQELKGLGFGLAILSG